MTEPEKESVRIALPSRPDKAPPSASAVKHDTVRIVLPSRTPAAPVRRVPPKITPMPASDSAAKPATISPRRPPGPETYGAITPLPAAEPRPARSIQAGPKNETARISILPGPAPAPRPAINMVSASKPLDLFDAIPRSFCWGLFGLASLIFLIQIWNYVVS